MLPVAVIGLLGFSAFSQAPEPRGPLDLKDLRKKVSLKMRRVDAVVAFGELSRVLSVPFILDFKQEPSVTFSVVAVDVSGREILSELSQTNRLEYVLSSDGIIVRREGIPGEKEPIFIGEWPDERQGQFVLEFVVSDASGGVVGRHELLALLRHVVSIKQGTGSKSVRRLDRGKALSHVEEAGSIELACVIQRRIDSSLDLITEGVLESAIDGGTVSQIRTVEKRSLAAAPIRLFRASNGWEVWLTRWQQLGVNSQ